MIGILLAFCLSQISTLVSAYATPGPCSGVCNNAHDPALIRRGDGRYFRFSTGRRIAIHSAPDISGPWSYQGAVIPTGSKISLPGRDDLWAPDVTKVGDTYYLLYAVSKFGSQDSAIGYATSRTLDAGSWSDGGSTGVSSRRGAPYNAIDGNLIRQGNQTYMAYGSFWQDLHVSRLSLDTGRIRKSGGDTQIAFQPAGAHDMEAPTIFENDGRWWLIFSAGKCCGLDRSRPPRGQEYRIMACVSVNGPTGPFNDQSGKSCRNGGGTVVLPSHSFVYAPGGQGVYRDASLGLILYYHYVDTRIGYADGQKKFGWNKLRFTNGWPTV